MEDRLRECPFCGGKAVLTYKTLSEVFAYAAEFTIQCERCMARVVDRDDQNPKGGYAMSGTGKPRVIKRWNTRTIDPLVEKMVEALTILSSCWFYGNWIAETYNERKLQHIMEDLGYWPTTEDKILERVQEYRERRDDTI